MSTNKHRVLIVDDTPGNIQILMETLKSDYSILAAIDGEKALKAVQKQPRPDLILLDVMMPGMDGYEVCRRLKADSQTARIPVIFITALSEEEDEAKGLALGAVDYITKPFRPGLVKARVQNHITLKAHRDELEELVQARTVDTVIRLVMASEARDSDTGMHIRRIQHSVALLAQAHGLPQDEAETMGLAATMHDIGKIGIPDRILLKPGRLDEEEWAIMRKHCEMGAENLEGSDSYLLQTARLIALTHHEKWDGTGYPRGLKGEDIPLGGRLTSLADVFDALTSKRPYKEAWPVEKALEVIREGREKHFDPDLTGLFLDHAREIAQLREAYADDDDDTTFRAKE